MRFAKSSIGAKVVMAVTGVILVGYLVLHVLGNLLVFTGPDKINGYGAQLHEMAALLWAVRVVLIVSVLLHIASGLRLTMLNKRARPEGYATTTHTRSTLASRTMAISGVLLLAFIVYHLLHFTIGVTHPDDFALRDPLGHRDVFQMVVRGFSQPAVAVGYLVAMVLVGMHLRHGIASVFQSTGVTSPKYRPLINRVGVIVAIILAIGFASIPLAIMAGLVKGV
jgi:succinate dehydrogenase / fumarate reductase, cytochrome b subunit